MQEATTLALCEALLDFAATPGRHALRLREPALLFDELDLVALWALGRLPEGMAEPQAVRQAALLFVLRACFAPGLNHYQLLGLSPSFSAAQLRARYRALIRLTHPDMGIEGLPMGAAGMVNRAHAVLADEAQRALYDRQLLTQMPSAAVMPTASGPDAGRFGAVAPGVSGLASMGSRGSLLHHAASMRVVRWVLVGGVLLLGAVLALGWAMRSSGSNGRLVAHDRGVSMPHPAAAEPQTVRLRIPAQWSNGIDVPVASVQVPSEPAKDLPAPSAKLAEPAAPAPSPSFLASLTSAFKAAPEKSAEVALAAASAAVGSASSSLPASPVTSSASSAAKPSTTPAPPPSPALTAAAPPAAKAAPTAAQTMSTTASASASAPGPRWPSTKVDITPASVQPNSDVPAVAGRNTVWDVDVPSARTYLQDLLNQLEQAEQARNTSHALTQMNVHGSLLMPPGAVGDAMQMVQIERVDLSESHRPGVLRIRGVLKAQVSSASSKPRAVRWRVQAEFRGTAQGTVLTLLDLKDAE